MSFDHQFLAEIGGQRRADSTGNPSLPNGHERGSQAGQQQAGNDGQQELQQLSHGMLRPIGLQYPVDQDLLQDRGSHVDGYRAQRQHQQEHHAAPKGTQQGPQPGSHSQPWGRFRFRAAIAQPAVQILPSRPVFRPAGRRAEVLAAACIETAHQIGQFSRHVSRPAQDVDPLPVNLHLKEMRADGRFHAEGFDLLPTPLPPTLGRSIAGKIADHQLPLIDSQPLGSTGCPPGQCSYRVRIPQPLPRSAHLEILPRRQSIFLRATASQSPSFMRLS